MFGSLGIFQAMVQALKSVVEGLIGTTSDTYASNTLFGYAKYAGTIKSIQRGTINLSAGTPASATISAVTTAKTMLNFCGFKSGGNYAGDAANIRLVNSTTVTAACCTNYDSIVSYEVIEFY